jgi:uncharacterized protein YlxW (UPF0749 family)
MSSGAEVRRPQITRGDGWVWQVTALSAVLGVMLSLAIRTEEHIRNMGLPSDRHGVSAADMKKWKDQDLRLQAQIRQLRSQITEFRSSFKDKTRSSDLLKKQLREYRALTGFAPVAGPGLRITLSNSPIAVLPGTKATEYLASDQDLISLVNEIWAAGAEAVAVSGAGPEGPQRFVVSTTVRPAGKGVVIDGRNIGAPYHVLAIGNPKELRAALSMNEGIIQTRGLDILKMISIEEAQHLVLPAHDHSSTGGRSADSAAAPHS